MKNWKKIHIYAILTYIFMHSVMGQEEEIQWTILQYEGLDNVFIQAQTSGKLICIPSFMLWLTRMVILIIFSLLLCKSF